MILHELAEDDPVQKGCIVTTEVRIQQVICYSTPCFPQRHNSCKR